MWGVFAVVLLVVFVTWMIANPGPEHIDDTNGAETTLCKPSLSRML